MTFTRKVVFSADSTYPAHQYPSRKLDGPPAPYFRESDESLQRLPAQRPFHRAPLKAGQGHSGAASATSMSGKKDPILKTPAPLPAAHCGLSPERSHARRRCLYRNPRRYRLPTSDPAARRLLLLDRFRPQMRIDLLELYETTGESAISKRRTAVHGSIPNIFGIARKFLMRTSP